MRGAGARSAGGAEAGTIGASGAGAGTSATRHASRSGGALRASGAGAGGGGASRLRSRFSSISVPGSCSGCARSVPRPTPESSSGPRIVTSSVPHIARPSREPPDGLPNSRMKSACRRIDRTTNCVSDGCEASRRRRGR